MKPLSQRYDAFIWDWNGTLIDDMKVCVEILNRSLVSRGLPVLTAEKYLEIFEFPVINFYRSAGFDFSRERFEDVGMEYIRAYESAMFDCPLHGAAKRVLDDLKARGKRQYILSALYESDLKRIIEHFGLSDCFADVRGLTDQYARSKVDLGKRLVAECGVDPAKALMIGDTLHDLETARHIGIDCVLVAAGHNSHARLATGGVPVYRSLDELVL
ncbi:MAG TPA: HAD family hydrolase [Candidatus Ozemobacteraceae bacterium]